MLPYDHKQHTTESEEMLNLINSVRNIQQPFTEIWDELSLILTGKLPAEPSSIDQSEINRKIVQIQMVIDATKEIRSITKTLFDPFQNNKNKIHWDHMIRYSNILKKNIINLFKVFITFLQDEQLLMIAIGEDTVSSMQEISNINKDLVQILTNMTSIFETLRLGYRTTIHHLYNTLKYLKKELDGLHKALRRKANMKYRYIYDTNDFHRSSYDNLEEFNQGNTILYKKIISFFLPFKNILNNLHVFSGIISENTQKFIDQLKTSQNSVLSLEAIEHIPKTDTLNNI